MMKDYLLFKKIRKIKLLALDFDGVLTDGFVYVDKFGLESVRCSRRDSLGIEMLKNNGIEVVVISKEKNPVVSARCKKMNIKCWHGIYDGGGKLIILKTICKKMKLLPEEICYVGDDVNDLPCLDFAGAAITVADGNDKNKKVADYITKRKGGDHAVREICDLILESKGKI